MEMTPFFNNNSSFHGYRLEMSDLASLIPYTTNRKKIKKKQENFYN